MDQELRAYLEQQNSDLIDFTGGAAPHLTGLNSMAKGPQHTTFDHVNWDSPLGNVRKAQNPGLRGIVSQDEEVTFEDEECMNQCWLAVLGLWWVMTERVTFQYLVLITAG